ncbi:glycoside hydrolase family 5 protein [Tilletiaria anomala UBC 951]|uniref:Glycoside hydrolase family 5 protein n=1 Tax=Tilletiaria anomala (strain ATCC 24038 / CBS 436.72 / UBC 951) TaxID=1037660 RepID=A0A066WHH3_TILAU|nr:glycoside hydrolase family 5 protein [Tilletiaria anomala UBC 951]KDN51963.1 glycoside hydrolase family 5 protein [Tilletiaria anomala UBC 951]
MNKLLRKVGSKLQQVDIGQKQGASASPASASFDITAVSGLPSQVLHYRFRKQRGVNLGSWFSLETWLTPSLFAGIDGAKSEFDLVSSSSGGKLSSQDVSARLNHHWGNFINDGDWIWIKEHGINTVRLPIAYFHFLPAVAPHLMQGTEYEPYAAIYEPAWGHVKRAIETAGRYSIGVMVDLHGCPGAQGTDGHTGLSNGSAGMWDGSRASFNQARTIEILVELIRAIGSYENVIGLELMNEPRNSGRLAGFYDEAIHAIRGCSPDPKVASLPLYLSDSWDLNYYSAKFGSSRQKGGPANMLVIDHHLYRVFTPQDAAKSSSDHAKGCRHGGGTAQWMKDMAAKADGNIVIGEWSSALHHISFRGGDHQAQQKDWGHSQLDMYEKHCAGYYFWTLKKEGNKDLGWCLYSAIEQGVLPSNLAMFALGSGRNQHQSREELERVGVQECQSKFGGHKAYWRKHGGSGSAEGGPYEHWRYEAGFQAGWVDSLDFWFASQWSGGEDHQLIGYKHNLMLLRLAQHAREKGGSRFGWEFEHGFNAALQAFDGYIRR